MTYSPGEIDSEDDLEEGEVKEESDGEKGESKSENENNVGQSKLRQNISYDNRTSSSSKQLVLPLKMN